MEPLRMEKIKAATERITIVLEALELNDTEIEVLAKSAYEAVLQQKDRNHTQNKKPYLSAAISAVAVIISMISIIASILK